MGLMLNRGKAAESLAGETLLPAASDYPEGTIMTVPDYQSLMLPLLKFADEQNAEISTGDAVEALGSGLGLTSGQKV
jgi:hypothetical protein